MAKAKAQAVIELPRVHRQSSAGLNRLREEALQGNEGAIEELLDLAQKASKAVSDVWDAYPGEMRNHATGMRYFPILYSWRKDENRMIISRVKTLRLDDSVFTTLSGLHLDDKYFAVRDAWKILEGIRTDKADIPVGSLKQQSVIQQIKRLKPITSENCREWGRVFADLHANFSSLPFDNGIYREIASPERELNKRKRRARERVVDKYGPDREVKNLNAIAATKRQVALERIERMEVTPADFRNTLADEVGRRMKRMLRK